MSETIYFTIPFQHLMPEETLPYDLYVNASLREGKYNFVKIASQSQFFSHGDQDRFSKKFSHLYLLETQRNLYLNSLTSSDKFNDLSKTEILKNSAINYLSGLFDQARINHSTIMPENIEGLRNCVENMVQVLQNYSVLQLQKLIGLLSFHDFYTFDHSINVSMYCIVLQKTLNPTSSLHEITTAGMAGMLHDIGKIKISNSILNSTQKLTEKEFAQIKMHPQWGLALLQDSPCQCPQLDLELVGQVILQHHENYNGSGYPNQFKGTEIHPLARLTAIADFFDAITTQRSYHQALSPQKALELMTESKGKKIDPELFEIFKSVIKSQIKVSPKDDKVKTLSSLPDSFDPCMPYITLPIDYQIDQKFSLIPPKSNNFGKIKIIDGSPQPAKKVTQ